MILLRFVNILSNRNTSNKKLEKDNYWNAYVGEDGIYWILVIAIDPYRSNDREKAIWIDQSFNQFENVSIRLLFKSTWFYHFYSFYAH